MYLMYQVNKLPITVPMKYLNVLICFKESKFCHIT